MQDMTQRKHTGGKATDRPPIYDENERPVFVETKRDKYGVGSVDVYEVSCLCCSALKCHRVQGVEENTINKFTVADKGEVKWKMAR